MQNPEAEAAEHCGGGLEWAFMTRGHRTGTRERPELQRPQLPQDFQHPLHCQPRSGHLQNLQCGGYSGVPHRVCRLNSARPRGRQRTHQEQHGAGKAGRIQAVQSGRYWAFLATYLPSTRHDGAEESLLRGL